MKPQAATSDGDLYRLTVRLFSLAHRVGVDAESATSWGQLAALVRDKLGDTCDFCAAKATDLGFWIPADPQLLGSKITWSHYLHCGEHEVDEIEAQIAEKHGRTS